MTTYAIGSPEFQRSLATAIGLSARAIARAFTVNSHVTGNNRFSTLTVQFQEPQPLLPKHKSPSTRMRDRKRSEMKRSSRQENPTTTSAFHPPPHPETLTVKLSSSQPDQPLLKATHISSSTVSALSNDHKQPEPLRNILITSNATPILRNRDPASSLPSTQGQLGSFSAPTLPAAPSSSRTSNQSTTSISNQPLSTSTTPGLPHHAQENSTLSLPSSVSRSASPTNTKITTHSIHQTTSSAASSVGQKRPVSTTSSPIQPLKVQKGQLEATAPAPRAGDQIRKDLFAKYSDLPVFAQAGFCTKIPPGWRIPSQCKCPSWHIQNGHIFQSSRKSNYCCVVVCPGPGDESWVDDEMPQYLEHLLYNWPEDTLNELDRYMNAVYRKSS